MQNNGEFGYKQLRKSKKEIRLGDRKAASAQHLLFKKLSS